jgi:hypothetical protein
MASSYSLTICIIINSMIPVPYILLYSYLRIIYLLPHACNPNSVKELIKLIKLINYQIMIN